MLAGPGWHQHCICCLCCSILAGTVHTRGTAFQQMLSVSCSKLVLQLACCKFSAGASLRQPSLAAAPKPWHRL